MANPTDQVRNAINYVCLAGAHQEEKRGEVLALLDYYHQGREAPEVPPPDSFFHTVSPNPSNLNPSRNPSSCRSSRDKWRSSC